MEQGSGIVSPSKHGYNIGDKIITLSGGQSTSKGLIHGYRAYRGDKGIITGVNFDHTEILYENGSFGVRYEAEKLENIKVVEKATTTPTYEIY